MTYHQGINQMKFDRDIYSMYPIYVYITLGMTTLYCILLRNKSGKNRAILH